MSSYAIPVVIIVVTSLVIGFLVYQWFNKSIEYSTGLKIVEYLHKLGIDMLKHKTIEVEIENQKVKVYRIEMRRFFKCQIYSSGSTFNYCNFVIPEKVYGVILSTPNKYKLSNLLITYKSILLEDNVKEVEYVFTCVNGAFINTIVIPHILVKLSSNNTQSKLLILIESFKINNSIIEKGTILKANIDINTFILNLYVHLGEIEVGLSIKELIDYLNSKYCNKQIYEYSINTILRKNLKNVLIQVIGTNTEVMYAS